jgi:hypothetical protein
MLEKIEAELTDETAGVAEKWLLRREPSWFVGCSVRQTTRNSFAASTVGLAGVSGSHRSGPL